jgi:hypothetical protein
MIRMMDEVQEIKTKCDTPLARFRSNFWLLKKESISWSYSVVFCLEFEASLWLFHGFYDVAELLGFLGDGAGCCCGVLPNYNNNKLLENFGLNTTWSRVILLINCSFCYRPSWWTCLSLGFCSTLKWNSIFVWVRCDNTYERRFSCATEFICSIEPSVHEHLGSQYFHTNR